MEDPKRMAIEQKCPPGRQHAEDAGEAVAAREKNRAGIGGGQRPASRAGLAN